MSQQSALALSRCFGRDIVHKVATLQLLNSVQKKKSLFLLISTHQRAGPFFNAEEPITLESGDAVVAWHPIHRCDVVLPCLFGMF